MHMHRLICNVKIHRFSLLLIDIGFMDLSSVHGNKLQMRYSHHYKSVDVRVQIKEMFLFFSYFEEKIPIFSYFSAFSFLFSYFLQVIWHLTPCSFCLKTDDCNVPNALSSYLDLRWSLCTQKKKDKRKR